MIKIAKQSEEIPDDIFEDAPSPEGNAFENYKKDAEPQIDLEQGNETYMENKEFRAQPVQNYGARDTEEKIQEIAELIVDEKWNELTKRLGNLSLWKSRVETEITAIKQEILRMQGSFQNLQNAIAGKLNDYNQNIINVNSEMKALEGVLQKIIEPLSQNIKELNRISNDLKSASKSKK